MYVKLQSKILKIVRPLGRLYGWMAVIKIGRDGTDWFQLVQEWSRQ
jgi:hypothetical protein